jgi:hypothetical protein
MNNSTNGIIANAQIKGKKQSQPVALNAIHANTKTIKGEQNLNTRQCIGQFSTIYNFLQ